MARLLWSSLMLILFSLMTNSLYSVALSASENADPILLPSQGNANPAEASRPSSACNQKYRSLSCPVSCFRPDPVCGVDGITYWCGCADAQCAGVEVAKTGFCEVGNGGHGLLSGQALLLVHIVWLILLGIFVLMGLP